MQRSDYIPMSLSGVIEAQTQSGTKRSVAKLFRHLPLLVWSPMPIQSFTATTLLK
jgi:hypothetical protein